MILMKKNIFVVVYAAKRLYSTNKIFPCYSNGSSALMGLKKNGGENSTTMILKVHYLEAAEFFSPLLTRSYAAYHYQGYATPSCNGSC